MSAARAAATLAAALVSLAFAGAAQASCGGLLPGLLSPVCPSGPSAPDPGGQEEPDQPVPGPGKGFGFNSSLALVGSASPEEELGHARRAGATLHRMALPWRSLQRSPDDPPVPEPGPGNQVELLDTVYAEALERGITPVFVTFWAPVWASRYRNCALLDIFCHGMANSSAQLVPDWPFLDEYETFVRAVKQRWPRALIEPWNEPNLYWDHPFFRGTRAFAASPGHFARIQCAAYRGSKSVNDDAVIAAGWARRAYMTYVDGVYRAGGDDCWDIGNLHVYSGSRTRLGEGSWFARALHEARTLRTRHGDSDPIWITEIGWTTSGGREHRVSMEDQADAARRAYNRLVTMPDVGAVLFHTLRDSPTPERPYNEPGHYQYGFGFLREDWSPKPVYCGFAARAGNAPAGC
ncbi:MAG: hypothetical protein WD844_11880 [Thermoleophilaceae bacterium]